MMSVEYLGASIPLTIRPDGTRFVDLSDKNRENLIAFGKKMELTNCLEVLQRWVFTIGGCFGGDKKISDMACKKLRQRPGGLEFVVPRGTPKPQETSLERLFRYPEESEFKISVKGDTFQIVVTNAKNNHKTTMDIPIRLLVTKEEYDVKKENKITVLDEPVRYEEILREKLCNAEKNFLVTIGIVA